MPIQFRCGSCQQLLGIARRKAGAIVHCPTCRQKTRVPLVKENVAPPPPSKVAVNQPVSIFDRVDVDKLLSPVPVEKSHRAGEEKPHLHPGEIQLPSLTEEPTSDPVVEEKPSLHFRAPKEPETFNNDEPFTLTSAASVPVRPVLSKTQLRWLWGMGGLVVVVGMFFLGHWLGAHRPLF